MHPVHSTCCTLLCRPGIQPAPRSEALERAVTLRKLLARQILKLERGGTSLQPVWEPQGFNAQDPTLLVRKGRCAHSRAPQAIIGS
jgi:hypothetical protein